VKFVRRQGDTLAIVAICVLCSMFHGGVLHFRICGSLPRLVRSALPSGSCRHGLLLAPGSSGLWLFHPPLAGGGGGGEPGVNRSERGVHPGSSAGLWPFPPPPLSAGPSEESTQARTSGRGGPAAAKSESRGGPAAARSGRTPPSPRACGDSSARWRGSASTSPTGSGPCPILPWGPRCPPGRAIPGE
jgi:hypothetical protein